MTDIETEMRHQLAAGVADAEVDISMLATGGIARGQRFVRRRRITKTIAAGGTVAIAAGVFAYAVPRISGDSPGVATAPYTQPAPTTDLTPQAALKILLELLPPDAKTGDYSGGDATRKPEIKSPAAYAHSSYTDSAGKSNLMLYAGRLPRDSCAGRNEDEQCTETPLPGGSHLTVSKIAGPDSAKAWSVSIDRKDGMHVNLIADNSEQDKGPGTRPAPPLSIEQLRAIVTSPRWQLRVDKAFAKQAESLFVPTPAAPVSTPPPYTSPSPR